MDQAQADASNYFYYITRTSRKRKSFCTSHKATKTQRFFFILCGFVSLCDYFFYSSI